MLLRIVLLALFLPVAALGGSLPSPTKSEYLVSEYAGFQIRKGDGAYYLLRYSVRKALPSTVYVVALFDNPEHPDEPLRREEVVDGTDKDFELTSPFFQAATLGRTYKVHLTLYADSDHTHLIGTHDQEVMLSVPPELAEKFGLKVQ